MGVKYNTTYLCNINNMEEEDTTMNYAVCRTQVEPQTLSYKQFSSKIHSQEGNQPQLSLK